MGDAAPGDCANPVRGDRPKGRPGLPLEECRHLVRFGLGPHTSVKQVEVRWPGGGSQKLTGVMGDRIIEIEEDKP